MPFDKVSYLDPFVLAQIESLELRARLAVEGFISGLHHSRSRGHSMEFAEHREYVPGDELKNLDWKVYGKSDRFFVKQFEDESNMRVYILLDCSGSMAFKGAKSPLSKFDYAATYASSLAYLGLQQGDSIGLSLFSRFYDKLIPPRNSLAHLNILLEELINAKVQGETSLSDCLIKLSSKLKKRSLIILLSDLFDEQESVISALKFLRFRKHEVMVLHLLDPDENDFPYQGIVQFKSLEKEDSITMDSRLYKKDYQSAVARWIGQYRVSLRNANIQYSTNVTNEPLEQALRSVLIRS